MWYKHTKHPSPENPGWVLIGVPLVLFPRDSVALGLAHIPVKVSKLSPAQTPCPVFPKGLYFHSFSLFPQTLEELKKETKPIKIDRRLTGSNFIDEPLQQVVMWKLISHSLVPQVKVMTQQKKPKKNSHMVSECERSEFC